MTHSDSAQFSQWLRRAGIIDAGLAAAIGEAFERLPLPAGFGDRLTEVSAEPLRELGDSVGAYRCLQRFVAARVADGTFQRSVIPLVSQPEQLRRLLQAFDLGSEPRRWLIDGLASYLPPTLELPGTLDDSSAHPDNSGSASGHLEWSELAANHKTLLIDIALEHFSQATDITQTMRRASGLADAVLNAAVTRQYQMLCERFGPPRGEGGRAAGYAVMAIGRLGSQELTHNDPLQLVLIHTDGARTDGLRPMTGRLFFERLAHEISGDLMPGADELRIVDSVPANFPLEGALYPLVWWRANRQAGESIAHSHVHFARRLDAKGRTWQRRVMLPLRFVSGDRSLARETTDRLSPWLYRRYLSEADLTGVAALKRRLLRQLFGKDFAFASPGDAYYGIELAVHTVRLLQLSLGYRDEEVRRRPTLAAIDRLIEGRHVQAAPAQSLGEALRQLFHLNYAQQLDPAPIKEGWYHRRREDSQKAFEVVRQSAAQLLWESQSGTSESRSLTRVSVRREDWDWYDQADLVLDPSPPRAWVSHVLRSYRFSDPQAVYELLQQMGEENIDLLSTRRCRLQLAKIAPLLLAAAAETPSPIATLQTLNRITRSLGGKRVLWRLFAEHPAAMDVMIRLSAACPYLTGILTQSPGMIDELVDSLLLGRLPTCEEISDTLRKWIGGSGEAAMGEFKQTMHLRIGIRNLIKPSVAPQAMRSLSAVADALIRHEFAAAAARESQSSHGLPDYALLACGAAAAERIGYRRPPEIALIYDDRGVDFDDPLDHAVIQRLDRILRETLRQLRPTGGQPFAPPGLSDPRIGWDGLAIGLSRIPGWLCHPGDDPLELLGAIQLRPLAGDQSICRAVEAAIKERIATGKADMLAAAVGALQHDADSPHGLLTRWEMAVATLRQLGVQSPTLDKLDQRLAEVRLIGQLADRHHQNELTADHAGQNRVLFLLKSSRDHDLIGELQATADELAAELPANQAASQRKSSSLSH